MEVVSLDFSSAAYYRADQQAKGHSNYEAWSRVMQRHPYHHTKNGPDAKSKSYADIVLH